MSGDHPLWARLVFPSVMVDERDSLSASRDVKHFFWSLINDWEFNISPPIVGEDGVHNNYTPTFVRV